MGMVPLVAGIAAGSALYGAYTSYRQGQAAMEAGRYNALLARQAKEDALQRGAVEAGSVRSKAFRMAERNKARMLAQGITGPGVEDVVQGTIYMGGVDANTVMNNAAREAWGYENQAQSSLYEGRAARDRANYAAGGSILTGAAQVASALGGPKPSGAGGASPLAESTSAQTFRLKSSFF